MNTLLQLMRISFISLTSCLFLCFTTASYADQDTKDLIGGYGQSDMAKKQMVASPVDGPLIIAQENAQTLYIPYPVNPYAIEQTLLGLSKYFTPATPPAQNQMLANNQVTFGPPGTLPPSARNYYSAAAQSEEQLKQTTPFTNIDLNSLIGPLVYTKDDNNDTQKTAQNFIEAMGSINNPYPIVDLVALGASKSPAVDATTLATTNNDVIKYLNDLRTYGAAQAIALSNFYQMYAARVPTNLKDKNPDLYKSLEAIKLPNASEMQVENYMATRRLSDPGWVGSLAEDTPAALLRQIAILLAENLALSYKNHLATERLIATNSALVLIAANNLRPLLDQDVNTLTQSQKNQNSGNQQQQ